jgi:hypothetical protein
MLTADEKKQRKAMREAKMRADREAYPWAFLRGKRGNQTCSLSCYSTDPFFLNVAAWEAGKELLEIKIDLREDVLASAEFVAALTARLNASLEEVNNSVEAINAIHAKKVATK